MTEYERQPQPVGEILRCQRVIDDSGSLNKLGVLALVSGRELHEIDPLEVEPNEALSDMVVDPSTDLETLKRIDTIAKMRRQHLESETPQLVEAPDLKEMPNDELAELLRQGNLSDEMVLEIAKIARERSQGRGLSSSGD